MNIKETSNVIGTESGAIKSFLDQWTIEHALLEYVDNKNDMLATRVEFRIFENNGKYFLKVLHNGKPFAYDELFNYLKYFSYHSQYSEMSIGLRGCGRRWAMYTLIGYRYWNEPNFETVVVESCEGGTVHKGEIDIRFPNQQAGDVRMFEDSVCDSEWGNAWYTTKEIIPLFRKISFNLVEEEIRVSYPNHTNIEYNLIDETTNKSKALHSIDMTYAMKYINIDDYWRDVEVGRIKEIIEEGVGTFLLMLVKAPCGKVFKCINSVLDSKFLKETNNERLVKNRYAQHKYGGLYAYRGGRFIVHGNSKHLGNLLPDRGGIGNCRIIVDLSDDEIANDFGVRTNKSNGIDSIERSPILNPNETNTDGNSQERRNDRKKGDNFVLGVYDYILELSRQGYRIYGVRYSDACDKGGIENKKSSKRLAKSLENDSVLEKIGKTEACTSYLARIIDEKNLVKSNAFKNVLTKIVDCLEVNSTEVDGDLFFEVNGSTYDLIFGFLCENFKEENSVCLEESFTA